MKFERFGEGPALVLVPALACDDRLWGPVANRLSDRFQVVVPDTRNCGDLYHAAHQVNGIIDDLGIAPACVAGISMGGYVVFELLRHWPQRIRAAALLDTTAFADTAERVDRRRQVLRLLEQGRFDQVLEAFSSSVLGPGHASGGPVRAQLFAMAHALGPEGYASDLRAILTRGSYEDVLHLARVPLLFAAGVHDTLTPPSVARAMAEEVPGARAVSIPGAGHLSPLENPEFVAELLGTFFGDPGGTRGGRREAGQTAEGSAMAVRTR